MRAAVVGAGPSGIMAAIAAASLGAEVSLFDKNEFPGRKLLLTGNGKCNFSNVSVSDENYRGSLKDSLYVKKIYEEYGPEWLLNFFSSCGLLYKVKNSGYYPLSNVSNTVNDVLIEELKRLKVSFHGNTLVKKIERDKGLFFLSLEHMDSNKRSRDETGFDALIIATGGKAAPKTGSTGDGYYFAESFGLSVAEPLPALTRLNSPDPFFNDNKIRAEVSLTLYIDGKASGTSEGELQLSETGPSGICVFDLSGRAAKALKEGKKCDLNMDLLPGTTKEELKRLIEKRYSDLSGFFNPDKLFIGIFSERLSLNVREYLERRVFKSEFPSSLSSEDMDRIASEIKDMSFEITGTGDFNNAQVTSGGVLASSLNPDLSAVNIPGLYFCGEVLDTDGDCGGFNLQWAFSSGYAAGVNAVKNHDTDK